MPTQPQSTLTVSPDMNNAIRIARAEMERDEYRQAWQECERSFDNIKWVVQVALTAIGLILALFGLIIFKNTREFKEAVTDARKACEKAEEWEEKARTAFEKIDARVESKLKEIDERVKIELKQVENRGKESIQDIINQTQTETLRCKLWSNALNLDMKGKYDEACDKYAELVKLRPEDYLAYFNWGNSLYDLAMLKRDEKLFEQACQKYEQVLKVNPHMDETYNNWGIALGQWAKLKGDEKLFEQACQKFEQAKSPFDYKIYTNWGIVLGDWAKLKEDEKIFEQSCQKYEQSVRIKPNIHETYVAWGATLINWAKIKGGKTERENLLEQAEEKSLKAESLKDGEGAYNLACIYVLRGDKGKCREWFLTGQEAGTLPTRDQAMKDSDLDSVRDETWFKEIKWKGEK
jgi:tetratricopeptide (TPR) repeat protein